MEKESQGIKEGSGSIYGFWFEKFTSIHDTGSWNK